MKSAAEGRDRSVMRIRKLEQVDRRKYEDKLETIRKKMEERQNRDEQLEKIDEIK